MSKTNEDVKCKQGTSLSFEMGGGGGGTTQRYM